MGPKTFNSIDNAECVYLIFIAETINIININYRSLFLHTVLLLLVMFLILYLTMFLLCLTNISLIYASQKTYQWPGITNFIIQYGNLIQYVMSSYTDVSKIVLIVCVIINHFSDEADSKKIFVQMYFQICFYILRKRLWIFWPCSVVWKTNSKGVFLNVVNFFNIGLPWPIFMKIVQYFSTRWGNLVVPLFSSK